jgi:hypothetical protein
MSVFQLIALAVLAALLVWELVGFRRSPTRWGVGLVRTAVWLAAAVAVARPDWVQDVATRVGIGRGADVVLYLFVFLFLGTSFYFYSRYVRLQRQVTELVRYLAIRDARRPAESGGEPVSVPR